LCLAALCWPSDAHAAGISWAKSLPEALSRARRENKLVFADLYTDWCGYCKKLDAETFPDPSVVRAARGIVLVKLNAEKEGHSLARKYRVSGFPSILVLTPLGQLDGRISGFRPPEMMVQDISTAIDRYRASLEMERKLRQNPADVELAAQLATIYGGRSDHANGLRMIQLLDTHDAKNSRGHLSRTLGAVAAGFQEDSQFERAIPLLRRALKAGRDPQDVLNARMNLALSYIRLKQGKNALPHLRAVIAQRDIPPQLREEAQSLMNFVQSGGRAPQG
jgi:thioredoxin-like negative regulator of GroEL